MLDPGEYWEDRLSQRYDLQGVGCIGLGRSYNTWLYRVRGRVFRRLIRCLPITPKNLTVLDVGSGTGFYVEQWTRVGARVAGVDIALVAVKKLRSRFPENDFYHADISEGLCRADTYDVVSAFDVLFHIVDDAKFAKAISNIYRLVRPKGLFIFSENFVHHNGNRLEHQVSRTIEEIYGFIEEAGFEVITRVPMFSIMNSPVDCTSKYRQLGWKLMTHVIRSSELAGFAVGSLLFPFELLLTRKRESASTEIMVCRKPVLIAHSCVEARTA